jgi:hypothetical protein
VVVVVGAAVVVVVDAFVVVVVGAFVVVVVVVGGAVVVVAPPLRVVVFKTWLVLSGVQFAVPLLVFATIVLNTSHWIVPVAVAFTFALMWNGGNGVSALAGRATGPVSLITRFEPLTVAEPLVTPLSKVTPLTVTWVGIGMVMTALLRVTAIPSPGIVAATSTFTDPPGVAGSGVSVTVIGNALLALMMLILHVVGTDEVTASACAPLASRTIPIPERPNTAAITTAIRRRASPLDGLSMTFPPVSGPPTGGPRAVRRDRFPRAGRPIAHAVGGHCLEQGPREYLR